MGADKHETRPIAGYWRVSKDEPGKQSPADYEKAIKRWAKDKGLKVGAIFGDKNVSGKRGTTRPQQEELFDRLNEFSAVVVPRLDRLSRSMTEAIELCDIILDAGIDFVALDTPGLDTTTPAGSFARDMLLRIGQLYLDQISAGWRTVHERFAESGQYHGGGSTPYGYFYVRKKKDDDEADQDSTPAGLYVEPTAAEIVREIFDRYLHGESLHAISADLTARAIPTRSGGAWTHSTVKAILENPVYMGVLRRWKYRSKKVTNPKTGRPKDVRVRTGEFEDHPGKWEAIIDEPTWQKVAALRDVHRAAAKKSGAKNANRGRYLLSGLLVCGSCGTKMFHKGNLYVCPNKDCKDGGIGSRRADELVIGAFVKFVTNPIVLENIDTRASRPRPTNHQKALDDLDKKMDRLVERSLAATGPLAQKSFERKAAELEARREELLRAQAAARAEEITDDVKLKSGHAFINDLAKLDIDLTTMTDDSPEEHLKAVEGVLMFHEEGRTSQARQLLQMIVADVRTVPGTRPKELDIRWAGWTKRKPQRVAAPIKRRWQKKPEDLAS